MTVEEELDEARAQEAESILCRFTLPLTHGHAAWARMVGIGAAKLAREGWKPEDPLACEVRALFEAYGASIKTTEGLVLAALKRGIELANKSAQHREAAE